ncbi:MAG: hypothetical protein QOJ15_3211 [Bradyrhizobium sp.]|jgi:hypothetical protein|nr:hypothetical protein [Bradyrhizobium sp.]
MTTKEVRIPALRSSAKALHRARDMNLPLEAHPASGHIARENQPRGGP